MGKTLSERLYCAISLHSSGYDLLVPTSEQERPLIEIGASTRMISVTKLFKVLNYIFLVETS